MNGPLIGKMLWLEMDKDRSVSTFSPRKALISQLFGQAPGKDIVMVSLLPAAVGFFLLPRRLTQVALRYGPSNQESIQRTFELGHSYAEVLRLKNAAAAKLGRANDLALSRLGFASVYPWPKPSLGEVKSAVHTSQ